MTISWFLILYNGLFSVVTVISSVTEYVPLDARAAMNCAPVEIVFPGFSVCGGLVSLLHETDNSRSAARSMGTYLFNLQNPPQLLLSYGTQTRFACPKHLCRKIIIIRKTGKTELLGKNNNWPSKQRNFASCGSFSEPLQGVLFLGLLFFPNNSDLREVMYYNLSGALCSLPALEGCGAEWRESHPMSLQSLRYGRNK